ncbi:hypothetical protein [Acidiphilium sp.]|uniref:hypothetical protein n=1 Tax=Acidiphilium sp. TaxID=527 RepID=UPI003CFEB65E
MRMNVNGRVAVLTTPPETAARVILDAVAQARARGLIGADADAIDALTRLLAVRAGNMIGRRLGKPARIVNSAG